MIKIDPNIVLAIISFVAVFSPVVTTFINNRHQSKMKKLEMFELRKYEAISDFIKSTEEYYCNSASVQNFVNFNSAIANLYIYFSIPKPEVFDKIKECIKSRNYEKTQFAIGETVKFLSQQIHKK